MVNFIRPALSPLLATALLFSTACSSTDQEEMEEAMQEEMSQEDQEELVSEPAIGSSEVTSDEAVAEAMGDMESIEEESSESLSTELDKLSNPEGPETQEPPQLASDSEEVVSEVEEAETEDMADNTMLANDSMDNSETETSPVLAYGNQTDSSESGDFGEYVIEPGDTLGSISAKLYGTSGRWQQLAEDNSIDQPERIFPGDIVKYRLNKRAEEYKTAFESVTHDTVTVMKGDTLSSLANRLLGSSSYWKHMWKMNEQLIPNPNLIYSGQTLHYVDPRKVANVMRDRGLLNLTH